MTKASESYAVAIGGQASASGFAAISLGYYTLASASSAVALGYKTKATIKLATAMGSETTASGVVSTAMGNITLARGSVSTAMGNATRAEGSYTTATGYHTVARSYGSFVVGSYNDTLPTSSLSSWQTTDPLFIIGNGTDDANRSNAVTVLKNGNMGVGTTDPAERLDVHGNIELSYGNGRLLVSGGFLDIVPHSSSYGIILRDHTGNSSIWSSIRTVDATTDYLHLSMNSIYTSEGLVISDNGSVGVGTAAPVQKLTVNGNIGFITGADRYVGLPDNKQTLNIGPSYSTSTLPYGVLTRASGYIAFRIDNDATRGINMNSSGYVGFGVENPEYRIDLPNSSTNSGTARAYKWSTYSDERIKTGGEPIDYGIKEVMMLKPRRYDHHTTRFTEEGLELLSDKENTIGLFAQEVYKVIPEVVSKPENESVQLWSIEYQKLVPVLIKAIQEQQQIIEEQGKKIRELKDERSEVAQLRKRLARLESIMNAMTEK
jgi:hypothetical protein